LEVVVYYAGNRPIDEPYRYGIRRVDTGRHLGYATREWLFDAPPQGVERRTVIDALASIVK
jgi:hypothetical protein